MRGGRMSQIERQALLGSDDSVRLAIRHKQRFPKVFSRWVGFSMSQRCTGHRRVPMAENRITRQTRHAVGCYAVKDAGLPSFDRIPCLETPETRIKFVGNAILPKSPTAGPARPAFRLFSFDC